MLIILNKDLGVVSKPQWEQTHIVIGLLPQDACW